MTQQAIAPWRSTAYPRAQQFAAWQAALNQTYGPWDMASPARPEFHADIQQQAAGGFQIVNCICDPCAARSRRVSSTPDTLTLQLVLSGRERFSIDDQRLLLGPGDVLLWDSTRSMRFEVLERLHKISVCLPLARIRNWLPRSWHTLATRLPGNSHAAAVLHSFINSVSPRFLAGELRNGDALTEAVIGTLVGVLDVNNGRADNSPREALLLRLKHYIDSHLDDPELCPAGIARANGISLRYLHSLFEPEGTTVLQHVIKCRLERCQRELTNPSMAGRSITEIALACGFMSSSHFSRRFKCEFGLSPSDFRHQARSKHQSDN